MTDDERMVVQLLAAGTAATEVQALFPSVDLTKRELLESAEWHRQTAAGSGRLTKSYLVVRLMALIDDNTNQCPHCKRGGQLDEKTRAGLLTTLARLRGKSG